MTTDRPGTSDLPLVLEDLARAVDLGEQLGLGEELTRARDVLTQASHRRRLAPQTTVAALLGATGSGKSSLANALTGSEVSRTARTRPTTTQPLAIVPDTAAEATELLDWLAISHRVRVDGGWALGETTVLVDLPDIDSDEPAHRAIAQRMAGKVDVLVWVLDPEKYADGVVHRDFLIPMAAHAEVMVVALNQVDRLDPEGRDAVLTDLRRILEREGLGAVSVIPVSARTGQGIETLAHAVASVASNRLAGARSLVAHARRAASDMGQRMGIIAPSASLAGAPDPAAQQAPQVRHCLHALRQAAASLAGVDIVSQALEASDRHRAHARVGWFWLRWIAHLRRDPLRALHLGTGRPPTPKAAKAEQSDGATGPGVIDLSSLPPAGPAATGRLRSSAHVYAVAACSALPGDLAAQAVLRSDERAERLAEPLELAVAQVDYGAWKRPAWWGLANVLQWVTALTALIGGLWLVAIHVLEDYLLLISIDVPRWGTVPWPTILLLGGLLIGLVLAGLGTFLARLQARRHSRRIIESLRRATDEVIDVELVEPLRTETQGWAELTRILERITSG
ncbi:GTPase family protein [Actinomyces oris]|uniref:ABC transporter n=1 Tax=Actinomyces oris TaxID=544580 RepID=A0A1Q8I3Y2_9ACTO|nr:GTPase [Actinomyces oris]OLL15813.1 ABC transporter [Actinomyces oris]